MISKHIFYKTAAIFFMLLGLYKMLMDSLFISGQKFGPWVLCASAAVLYVFFSRIPRIKMLLLQAYETIDYHQQQIVIYFLGLETVKYIGYESISDYFLWLSMKIADPSAVNSTFYSQVTAYTIFFVSAAVIYIIAIKEYKLISAILFVFFILQWHFFIDTSYTNAVIYAAGFIMLHADSSLKENGRYVKNLGFSAYVPLAVFFLVIISVIFPWEVRAVEIQRLSDEMTSRFPVLERLRDSVEDKVAGGEFELSDTPFQPDITRLGGSVELTDEIIMRVKADRPYYLRGTVKEVYTGSQWQSVQDKIYLMEDNDFKMNAESVGYESRSITVYPDMLKTRTIFNPYFTYKVSGVDIELVYNDSLQIQRNKGDMNQQDPYTLEFFSPVFTSQRNYTEQELADLQPYFILPDTITERTRALALEITQGDIGMYDKLSSIEQYLRSSYPYSLSTSDLPEGADFVDHFLFTERKGYCTYYASAMGVMARSIGIATRYVEGFKMSEEKNVQGEYVIRKNRAHAWIEAYVPGSGWLTFEPTGSISQNDLLAANMQTSQDDISSGMQSDEAGETDIQDNTGSPREAEGSVYNEQTSGSQRNAAGSSLNVLIIILAAIIAVFALAYYYFRKEKFEKMTYRQRVIFYYNKMANMLTDESSLNGILSPAGKMDFLNEKYSLSEMDLGEYVERLIYSRSPVTDKDILFMQSLYEKIKNHRNRKKSI